jgi:hypothetical protein
MQGFLEELIHADDRLRDEVASLCAEGLDVGVVLWSEHIASVFAR